MRSQMLIDMSYDKKGWRPQPLLNNETNEYYVDRCMVSNGVISKLVIVEGDEKDIDKLLENKVMKTIRELVDRDEATMIRETIIFSAIAQATISQAQQFVGLVERDAKMTLNTTVNHVEKLVKTIQKEAIGAHGKQMEVMLDNLEDAAHRVYQKFGDVLIEGKLPEFISYVSKFSTTETPVKKLEATKKK